MEIPAKTPQRRQLPVEGYWPGLGLVLEYRERQHDEPISHFGKPNRLTVSGGHRGEQRRLCQFSTGVDSLSDELSSTLTSEVV